MRDALARTNVQAALILLRLMLGGVFLSEGIQEFLFADLSMWLGLVYLMIVGAGSWSPAARMTSR